MKKNDCYKKNKDGKTSLHIYLGMLFKTFLFCKKKIDFALLFLMEIVKRARNGQKITKKVKIEKRVLGCEVETERSHLGIFQLCSR